MDGVIAPEACCGACAHAAAVKAAGGAPPNPNAPLRFHLDSEGAPIGAELVVRQEGRPEVVHPIRKASILLGRTPPADVVIDHATLSRRQSSFRFTPSGEVWVFDEQSNCGTFINGESIGYGEGRQVLASDVVYVSEVTLEVRAAVGG